MTKRSICGEWRTWLVWLLLASASAEEPRYRDTFGVDEKRLSPTGKNEYWVLEPDYQLIFEGKEDGGQVRLTVTVLNETKKVDGVETRIVEERETNDGKLAEISRNYFAFDATTGNVYYFGEDVDMYKENKVVNHDGSWLSGVNGARYGLVMPGKVRIGDRYSQEAAPGVAMDRAEIVSVTEVVKTPAGTFKKCLMTKESTPLEPGHAEYKWYAPSVGLIRDSSLELVKSGFEKK